MRFIDLPNSSTRLNKPESEISSEDRERTKRIVYASLYGAGCRKLMDILGVSYEQTLSIIASFNSEPTFHIPTKLLYYLTK